MLEKTLVWVGALGLWLSVVFEAMALICVSTPGIVWYGVAIFVFAVILRVGLWLGE